MIVTWEQFLVEKHNQSYTFSSTHVLLPNSIAKEIIAWGKKNIPESDVYHDNDGGCGREDEIHATVLYGIHDSEPDSTKKAIADQPPFHIQLGETSIFSPPEKPYDVVKLEVKGQALIDLNKHLRDELEHTSKYEYKPHVTVAYVKRGEGNKYTGDKTFLGRKILVNSIVFSSKDGEKTTIPLEAAA
jgi:hypothetical protein